MKIVAIIASYRKRGNTARLVEMILESLHQQTSHQQESLEFESIFLGHQDIRFCRGCRLCFDRGESFCPLNDDLLWVKAQLLVADEIIAASPVYVDDISGIMKNWIDRMAHLCHRPGFAGKSVFLLTTSGTTPNRRALATLSTAFSTWGFDIIGKAGFFTGPLMPQEELKARYGPKAERIASRILRSIESQSALRPSFRSLMTFKIQQLYWQRCKEKSYDLDYWRNAGWTDLDCDFYIPHHAKRIKVGLARLTGSLLSFFALRQGTTKNHRGFRWKA